MEPININSLNKIFDNRIRVGIMSILSVNSVLAFNDLKELLQLTDGNLASHLKNLEENECISVKKGFIGRKPHTTYSATSKGKEAFLKHLDALEKIIKKMK